MSRRAVVVYALAAATLLLLLATSRTPNTHTKRKASRRLHPRSVPFDPLVSQMERRAAEEERLLDVEAFRERLDRESGAVLEEYFGEEGRLNSMERLKYLFPLLDQSPKDGFVSYEELEVWNRRQAMDRLLYITERRMGIDDHDGDGKVTLLEFLAYIPSKNDWNDKGQGKAGWWKDQFQNADVDGNGSLNQTEFNEFLHPEDSSNLKVQMWLLKEKTREMDQNQDGMLSFTEFRDRTHGLYNYYSDFKCDSEGKPQHIQKNAEQNFADLDVNGDKYLTPEELRPILHHLYPGELSQATYYTKYLIHEADDNKDGKLTIEEMLNHHHAFYHAVFEESRDDYEEDDDEDYSHDELR